MSTIPASTLVSVTPSVLGAGGSGVDVIGLVLTTNSRVPIGTVHEFADADSVEEYFGAGTTEAIIAGGGTNMGAGYFGGFTGATKLPASILFAQYNAAAVAAYLRGGAVSALTLAALQAISGTLIVTVDGSVRTAGALNLSAATSFSSAATIIATALNAGKATVASFTAAIATNVLTVSAVASGTLGIGQLVTGVGVDPGLYITALGTGTGGTGTYTLSGTDTVSSEAMTTVGRDVAVTYDSVSGGFIIMSANTGAISSIGFATGTTSATLKLTSATAAVTSQGAAAAVPGTFMDALVIQNSNWVNFMNAVDPDSPGVNTVKLAFAAWCSAQNQRFCYVCTDTDAAPTAANPATSSLGYLIAQAEYSGICLISSPSELNHAAFVCGAAASIDFAARGGRITFAYKAQAGLVAGVTDPIVANNLAGNPQVSGSDGNGYNFYGAYASANADFTWFQRGFVSGPFKWLDSYINQIWMNSQFQVALLNLQANARSIPYSTAGRALIEAALADPINAAQNFGAFGPGEISAAQAAAVNGAAGANISPTLQANGYYLQVLAASAAVRAARTTPPCTFWYIDQGSVQAINLASVALT